MRMQDTGWGAFLKLSEVERAVLSAFLGLDAGCMIRDADAGYGFWMQDTGFWMLKPDT